MRNCFGKGSNWSIASRNEHRLTSDLLAHVLQALKIPRSVSAVLPEGVSDHTRECDGQCWRTGARSCGRFKRIPTGSPTGEQGAKVALPVISLSFC